MYDLIVRKGRIVDGTGAGWFEGDVAVKDGKIAAVGKLGNEQATRVIEANNHVVAPGFIDMHTHSDAPILANPKAESKIRQGVTLEVVGNCGASLAPLFGAAVEGIEKALANLDVKLTWNTMAGYMDAVEAVKPSINIAPLIGLGTLRRGIVGNDNRPATGDELEQMQKAITQAMQEGAFGVSSGLIYPPGSFADLAELIALSRPAAAMGGFYATHMRNEDDRLEEAVAEAIAIGEGAAIPVQISHHKAVKPVNWGKINHTLKMIDEARTRGVAVTADQYPYIAGSTGLAAAVPLWAHDGGPKALLARLQDPTERAKIRAEIETAPTIGGSWDRVVVMRLRQPQNKPFEGLDCVTIGQQRGQAPVDAVLDILVEENLETGQIIFGMCEEDVQTVMRHPLVMIGSDGSTIAPYGTTSPGKPHPRSYGTFPRVLAKYVREEKVLTLEEAVRKMTSLTAAKLGLWDRGIIRPGMVADMVVFDPETVQDVATFDNPHQYANGIPYVIVSGAVVIDGGDHTGATPGKVLRKNQT
jgi:N-acyl-D-amino-acid deacylase